MRVAAAAAIAAIGIVKRQALIILTPDEQALLKQLSQSCPGRLVETHRGIGDEIVFYTLRAGARHQR